ncbi:hypothetical protein AB0P21_20785 [Kribbella sp. NPDC056861]|uniref:hypothetical protein n=1 Tax=Kribbella sp. NPDC056861 TaxID=3154857 RepID=UPI00343066D8
MRILNLAEYRRVVALIGTISVGAVGVSCSKAQDHPSVTEPLRYSYFTKSDLVVMDGTREVARQKVAYMKDYRGAVWTLDTKYVAAVIDPKQGTIEPSARKLLVIDATNGESRELACPSCSSLAPIGGSQLVAMVDNQDGPDSVFRFDLNETRAPVRLSLSLPAKQSSLSYPVFVSGVDGAALLTGLDGDGHTAYYQYKPDGSAIPVGSESFVDVQYRSFEGGAVTRTSDGQVHFAGAEGQRLSPDACASAGVVTLGSFGKSDPIFTDMSVINPAKHTAGVDSMVGTIDLWWERNGELHAVIWSATCDDKLKESSKPAEWRLAGSRWIKLSPSPVLAARPVGSGRVMLVNDSPDEDAASVKLEVDGKVTVVAQDARVLSAPPVASVDHLGISEADQPSSPSTTGPLAGSAFVGEWFVHGGSLTIRADGTATQSHRYGSCTSSKSDCYVESTLDMQLSTDKKIATGVVRSMRVVTYGENSQTIPVAAPKWEFDPPPNSVGQTYRYQFVAINIIKDLNQPSEATQPFWCNATNPPLNNGPCGA